MLKFLIMDRRIIITAVLFGIIAIILGAFGAHALKKLISPEAIVTFEVGVRYQMYHALFLLFIGTFAFLGEKERSIIFYLTIRIGTIPSVQTISFPFHLKWMDFFPDS